MEQCTNVIETVKLCWENKTKSIGHRQRCCKRGARRQPMLRRYCYCAGDHVEKQNGLRRVYAERNANEKRAIGVQSSIPVFGEERADAPTAGAARFCLPKPSEAR
jgi:hypothetical protein